MSDRNDQHEPLKKGDRVHRGGRPKRGCTPEVEEFYGTVLHVGFVSIERDGNPGFLVYEKETSLSLIPDAPSPEWENVYYNESGYEVRLLGGTLQRRKLADATSPEVSNDGNCKWCGCPKSNEHRNHDYQAVDCIDGWHDKRHGQGAECPSCRLTATLTMTGMRRMMPFELLEIHEAERKESEE